MKLPKSITGAMLKMPPMGEKRIDYNREQQLREQKRQSKESDRRVVRRLNKLKDLGK